MRSRRPEPAPVPSTAGISRRSVLMAAAPAAVLPLAACTGGGDVSEEKTLTVLAGSEIRDLEPLLAEMAESIGYALDITYQGTLDGTDALVSGGPGEYQATWFPSNYYLSLFQQSAALIDQQSPIMSSPVVLGLTSEAAARLGWSAAQPPSWQDLIEAVRAGSLTFGMTSPLSSNSGFSTLLEAATALSGTGTALAAADIPAVVEPLTAFSAGHVLTAGSSGWLAERFAENPGAADGIFNYESVLSGMSIGGQPLVLIAPSDGVVTADYPLTLLSGASEEARTAYQAIVAHLSSEEIQRRIAETTRRRTSTTTAGDAVVFETPYPASLETVQALLRTWFEQTRKPSRMWFQIDTSGSMAGERLEALKTALGVLTGREAQSANESLLALQPRETLTIREFDSVLGPAHTFSLSEDQDPAGVHREMDAMIDSLEAGGDTAIYSSLAQILQEAAGEATPETFTSVVVFTDGENTAGMDLADFRKAYSAGEYSAGSSDGGSIPVFAIAFGEADSQELADLTELTGGRVFDAGDDLTAAFREIRGYL